MAFEAPHFQWCSPRFRSRICQTPNWQQKLRAGRRSSQRTAAPFFRVHTLCWRIATASKFKNEAIRVLNRPSCEKYVTRNEKVTIDRWNNMKSRCDDVSFSFSSQLEYNSQQLRMIVGDMKMFRMFKRSQKFKNEPGSLSMDGKQFITDRDLRNLEEKFEKIYQQYTDCNNLQLLFSRLRDNNISEIKFSFDFKKYDKCRVVVYDRCAYHDYLTQVINILS